MSRLVARAEAWEKVYEAYDNINFAAFDYDTIKQSLIDHIKLYFPESFQDFIESSELIAIIESFAYVAELIAYRLDVDAHENFISVAQRKSSILRLAKLVSYNADRPLPCRGLVKITTVSTTENLIDATGLDLSNKIIKWGDTNNTSWKDQFILVMNRVLEQNFGTVRPADRFQIDNVLFELYALAVSPLSTGVLKYSAAVNGKATPLELVPVEYNNVDGIIERRPYNDANFTILYGQDGMGDNSDTTGFFCFTKQGILQRFRKVFDGVTPNQVYDVPLDNVNDTDVWFTNVDASTGATIDLQPQLQYRRETLAGVSGEWVPVDLAHAQNVIFNNNPRRNKYEVETRDNNRVRLIFGDGEFADIPSGTFDVWVRSSVDLDIIVPQSAVSNVSSSLSYVDKFGRSQTFTFTFSLINSLQNGSASESLEHIRTTAPAVYYSQDRMVNGQDYNTFMLQDSSILKLRAVNRTFAGDSKYIPWHDPSTSYENVKIFSNDGVIYFQDITDGVDTVAVGGLNELISVYVEPLLSSTDIFTQISSYGVVPANFRRTFNAAEKARLTAGLTPPPNPSSIGLFYQLVTNEWHVVQSTDDPAVKLVQYGWPSAFVNTPLITIVQRPNENKYRVNRTARRLVFESPTTTFWNNNSASRVIDYNTLASDFDEIVILQANTNYNRSGVLQSDWRFNILGLETILTGDNVGLSDTSRISILPRDENNDGIPDHLDINESINHLGLADIIKPKILVDLTQNQLLPGSEVTITLPIFYVVGQLDVSVENLNGAQALIGVDWFEDSTLYGPVSNKIKLVGSSLSNSLVRVTVNDYVYFSRVQDTDRWVVAPNTPDTVLSYQIDASAGIGLWKREIGRSGLNFAWFHHSTRYHLIDPSPTNIVDAFIIQKGYFQSLKRWLTDPFAPRPVASTPLDMRLAYGYLLDNKMMSDTIVLHPGKIKLLFGPKATTPLQSKFVVVRSVDNSLTDNQIKTTIVTTIQNFFDPGSWEFGETFYFTELVAVIHAALPIEINTVVLVPISANNSFGSLFRVQASEDEILYPDISVSDIELVTDINAINLKLDTAIACPIQRPNVFAQSSEEYVFDFTQLIPAQSWTVNHELGYYPITRVYSAAGFEVEPLSVTHISVTQTVIAFPVPTAGSVRLA